MLEEINRDPAFDFYCLVDSVELVKRLAEAARHAELGRPLQLIVEGGFHGGRTGCRQLDRGDGGGRSVVKAGEPYLSLRGVGGYEGLLAGGATPAETERLVDDFLDYLTTIAVACEREDHVRLRATCC